MKRVLFLVLSLWLPLIVAAAPLKSSTFEVSGWIPYWREDLGTEEVLPKLHALTAVNPFGYTVNESGVENDVMGVIDEPWKTFNAEAKKKKVRLIPTVMWHDGASIHEVLSDPVKRTAHIQNIVNIVENEGFDGIDIDFEDKWAETKPYFSLFLKEFYTAMINH